MGRICAAAGGLTGIEALSGSSSTRPVTRGSLSAQFLQSILLFTIVKQVNLKPRGLARLGHGRRL